MTGNPRDHEPDGQGCLHLPLLGLRARARPGASLRVFPGRLRRRLIPRPDEQRKKMGFQAVIILSALTGQFFIPVRWWTTGVRERRGARSAGKVGCGGASARRGVFIGTLPRVATAQRGTRRLEIGMQCDGAGLQAAGLGDGTPARRPHRSRALTPFVRSTGLSIWVKKFKVRSPSRSRPSSLVRSLTLLLPLSGPRSRYTSPHLSQPTHY